MQKSYSLRDITENGQQYFTFNDHSFVVQEVIQRTMVHVFFYGQNVIVTWFHKVQCGEKEAGGDEIYKTLALLVLLTHDKLRVIPKNGSHDRRDLQKNKIAKAKP